MTAEPMTAEDLAGIKAQAAEVVRIFGDNWPLEYDTGEDEVVCQYEDEDAPFTDVFITLFRTSQWMPGEKTSPLAEFLSDSPKVVPALVAEVERLTEERDQAIAHDRQLYPTQWAYDQACAALEKHRQRADAAEAERDTLRHALERAALSVEHDPNSSACKELPAIHRRFAEHAEGCPACDVQAALSSPTEEKG